MKLICRIIAVLVATSLLCTSFSLAESETIIVLGDEITVNSEVIGTDAGASVYLTHRIETHEDVWEELQGLENRVVTITDAGTYRISGLGEDLQMRVAADEDDEIRIILDGANISCRTAPAIAVVSAKETGESGEYGVTIELAGYNDVAGSHTEKTEEMDVKLSGAITSLVSLGFEGEGFLLVDGDNEGIEVKNGHMTFNGGNIIVNSGDDSLNASEDGVSVITVNNGILHLQVKPVEGGEGDGIDSNGSIVLNGGAVASYSHPGSMDSGIDSGLGCTINGGIVLGMGNMYDEISADSAQLFMALQFARPVNDTIVVTDMNGKVVVAAHMPSEGTGYSSFVFSTPDLPEGDYYLYLGGEITAENGEAVYTPGTQLQHSGMMGFGGMVRWDMQMPEGFEFPEGMERTEGIPEKPEGFEAPAGMPEMPEGDFDPGRMRPDRGFDDGSAGEASTVFHLASGSALFGGITTVE